MMTLIAVRSLIHSNVNILKSLNVLLLFKCICISVQLAVRVEFKLLLVFYCLTSEVVLCLELLYGNNICFEGFLNKISEWQYNETTFSIFKFFLFRLTISRIAKNLIKFIDTLLLS